MRYQGIIIRPPSEADSYLLQVTYGCSHNQPCTTGDVPLSQRDDGIPSGARQTRIGVRGKVVHRCTFCGTYLDQPFRVRPQAEVLEDIDLARSEIPETRRVFLCDGNAMILPTSKLLEILKSLSAAFPRLQRVGIYANARDILNKTDKDLSELAGYKLTIAYLGLESGHDEVLKRVKKGAKAEEMISAVQKAQTCGIKMSVIGLLGLGGQELSSQHALDTARAVSQMNPRYFSLLTLMLIPGTPLYESYQRKEFILPSSEELLQEMRLMVEHIDSHHTIFRTNHASNYAPIGGTFNKDKKRILKEIDEYLTGEYSLRPEFLRGL